MTLLRSKTFWTGLAAVVAALGAYLSGEASAVQAGQTVFTGLIAIFLRAGLVKLPRDLGRD